MAYKVCPRCGKQEQVEAVVCDACGRQYQTRVAPQAVHKGERVVVRLVLALTLLAMLLTALLLLRQFSA